MTIDSSTVRAALVRLGFSIGRLRPVRRHVVLATTHAPALAGNLLAIAAGLTSRGIPHVELVQRQRGGIVELALAPIGAVRAGYRLATARLFVVDDYFFPMYVIRPRPGTTRVQVWHACGALKKFGRSTLDKTFGREASFVERYAIHSNYDLALVSSMAVAPYYAEAYGLPIERLSSRHGIPRTDVLVRGRGDGRIRDRVLARHGVPAGRRIVLYAPTFRGERTTEARQPADLDLAVLRAVLGEDHAVLVRAHPAVRDRLRLGPDLAGFAFDVSADPDINELLLASDILVTDYSSALFEFALLDRPVVLFAPDHAAYDDERGLYIDYDAMMPGPICTTSEELAAHLRGGAFDLERVRSLRDWAFDVADGRATERFVDDIVVPALDG